MVTSIWPHCWHWFAHLASNFAIFYIPLGTRWSWQIQNIDFQTSFTPHFALSTLVRIWHIFKINLHFYSRYFTFMYLLLRISWTSQSIFHAFSASNSHFTKHRGVALAEQAKFYYINKFQISNINYLIIEIERIWVIYLKILKIIANLTFNFLNIQIL